LLKNVTTQSSSGSKTPETTFQEAQPNQMPFYPGPLHLPLTQEGKIPTSVLTAEQQRRYVAIISNYLKPDVEFRFGLNKLEIQVNFKENLLS
jgi:hypothetical protein